MTWMTRIVENKFSFSVFQENPQYYGKEPYNYAIFQFALGFL